MKSFLARLLLAVTLIVSVAIGDSALAGGSGTSAPPLSSATIKAAGGLLFRDPRNLRYPVSCRNGLMTGTNASYSQYAMSNRRIKRNGKVAVTDLQAAIGNWYVNSAYAVTNGPNRIKVNYSIQYPRSGGKQYPFYVNGSRDIYIEPGQTVRAVEPTGLVIPQFANFYVLEYVTAVDSAGNQLTSGTFPSGRFTIGVSGGVEKQAFNAAATDKTLTQDGETTAIVTQYNLFDALLLSGKPLYSNVSAPSYVLAGDSIMFGRREEDATSSDSDGNVGPMERAVCASGNAYGAINLGVSGTKASDFKAITTGSNTQIVDLLRDVGTHVIDEFAVNDLSGSATAAQLESDQNTIGDWFRNTMGIRPILTTATPVASSISVTNSVYNPKRVTYNAWVRSRSYSSSFVSYIELSDVYETVRDSGLWGSSSWTTDFIHPNATSNALVPTAVGDVGQYAQ